MDALFHDLKHLSANGGQVSHQAMIDGTSPFSGLANGKGFLLARIGDAVAGRNIHAAIYDAMRMCKDL